MDKSVNPDQYIVRLSKLNRQIIETQMAARKECIRILKENPSGSFIDIWERESNDWHYDDDFEGFPARGRAGGDIFISSVGLDSQGYMVFRAHWFEEEERGPYEEGKWCRFSNWVMNPYDKVYKFITKNLDRAKPDTQVPFDEKVAFEDILVFEEVIFYNLSEHHPNKRYSIKDSSTVEKFGIDKAKYDHCASFHFVRDTSYASKGWNPYHSLPRVPVSSEFVSEREYIAMTFSRIMGKELLDPGLICASEDYELWMSGKLGYDEYQAECEEVFNFTLDVGVRDGDAFRILAQEAPEGCVSSPFLLFPMKDVPVPKMIVNLQRFIKRLSDLVPGETLYCLLVNAIDGREYIVKKTEVVPGERFYWEYVNEGEAEALEEHLHGRNTPDELVMDILFFSGDKYKPVAPENEGDGFPEDEDIEMSGEEDLPF